MHESICFVKEALKELKGLIVSTAIVWAIIGFTLSLIVHRPSFVTFLLLGPTLEAVLIWFVYLDHKIKMRKLEWHRRQTIVMAQMLRETGVNRAFYGAFYEED
mgnify:CR=1 FL=1